MNWNQARCSGKRVYLLWRRKRCTAGQSGGNGKQIERCAEAFEDPRENAVSRSLKVEELSAFMKAYDSQYLLFHLYPVKTGRIMTDGFWILSGDYRYGSTDCYDQRTSISWA